MPNLRPAAAKPFHYPHKLLEPDQAVHPVRRCDAEGS
jgi:hypothetical protein